MHFPITETTVMSIGGSLLVPEGGPNQTFLKDLNEFVREHVARGRKFVLVVGGGRTARQYIDAAKSIHDVEAEDLDWLGIHATRLNGHLLRTVFRDIAHAVVVKNPLRTPKHQKELVVVAAGWKPGWSTDYVAARIAYRVGATHLINMSNIDQVYDADPRTNPAAKPQPEMTWKDYRAMVGNKWSPGLSAPFDPIASKFCHKHHVEVFVVGTDFANVGRLIEGGSYVGTRIHGREIIL